MARVNIVSINVLDNPSDFTSPLKLDITFEAFEHLPHDLEWELTYVGSGSAREHDQVLDSVFIGPTPEGRHKFVFEASAPDSTKIPADDVVGVTVMLLTVKYNSQEFINLGWYVSVEYTDPELVENPPSQPVIEKLSRKVLVDDIRVTNYPIKWDDKQQDEYPPEQEDVNEGEVAFDLAQPEEEIQEEAEEMVETADVEEEDLDDEDESDEDDDDEDEEENAEDGEEAMEDGDEAMEAENSTGDSTSKGKVEDYQVPDQTKLSDVTNA